MEATRRRDQRDPAAAADNDGKSAAIRRALSGWRYRQAARLSRCSCQARNRRGPARRAATLRVRSRRACGTMQPRWGRSFSMSIISRLDAPRTRWAIRGVGAIVLIYVFGVLAFMWWWSY